MVFHEPLALPTALQAHLDTVGDLSPDAFDRFSQLIPADGIEQALQSTGTASLRRRRLPAERLIWLVIGPQRTDLAHRAPLGSGLGCPGSRGARAERDGPGATAAG